MKKTLLIALLAGLASAATISARAEDLAAARKAIEAQYARLDAAQMRRDPSPFEGLVTPDFRLVSLVGDEMDRGQAARSWKLQAEFFETLTTGRSEVLANGLPDLRICRVPAHRRSILMRPTRAFARCSISRRPRASHAGMVL